MTDQPENPPVFPQSVHPDQPFGGMTLRDYFAAAALPALIPIGQCEGWFLWDLAEAAYDYADAMLRERGK